MEIKTVKYHHKDIGYRVSGTGHPVMLIHGFGEDGTMVGVVTAAVVFV